MMLTYCHGCKRDVFQLISTFDGDVAMCADCFPAHYEKLRIALNAASQKIRELHAAVENKNEEQHEYGRLQSIQRDANGDLALVWYPVAASKWAHKVMHLLVKDEIVRYWLGMYAFPIASPTESCDITLDLPSAYAVTVRNDEDGILLTFKASIAHLRQQLDRIEAGL